MEYRILGKTGYKISEISLGTWQLGSKWGDPFNQQAAQDTLEAAYQAGVNFFDTADIYQDGESEKAIGEFLAAHPERKITVSTKMGRALDPHTIDSYTKENLEAFVDKSLKNLKTDSLDLILLHCPPTDAYYHKEIFDTLDAMKADGRIKHYGVSVERIEEAIKAMDYDISAVEIIFNIFRQKPADLFFKLAKAHNVGVIVRVPLASGLLTGKYTLGTKFGKNDHRNFNRHGEAFDKGETFAGVDYETGVKAATELTQRLGTDQLAQTALRWILMFDAVSTIIPGASNANQINANTEAAELPALTPDQMVICQDVYQKYFEATVKYLW
ncbi:oxidoreductase [Paucilactobacillus oligofermentans DSM 15707 = LMG 22743]|uniref:Oxidoreductase n=1 Tax=Paucilactobacillus oligofermentans DSM 15707 = LMG 22743 TaxID=1423778 RepID=A0A0R1RFH0_9LACO|nr:aldo/keto reductase [Paucilactobacillus oligofermentans]KRL55709.1 oxidoreductase [Paucilactobacillus oligofermentans DSM 15707 = LMG 22743]CUS27075.1 Putative aldo/keto reductase family protein [Paucilactobacillus oligofermentans DSM 15707 = LMG 22743]